VTSWQTSLIYHDNSGIAALFGTGLGCGLTPFTLPLKVPGFA
jgi:hypothetical protein